MKKILLFGAGRSASHLIHYLLDQSNRYDWLMTVVDSNTNEARRKVNGHERAKVIGADIFDDAQRQQLILEADLVISLLPTNLHTIVAKDCLALDRHLCTASYVSDEMAKLAEQAQKKNLIFMGELGLDPGLDHMSAMRCIDQLKDDGAKLLSFKSYTGGLVAPDSDDNPWHYKVSWNPRNVVLAGQGMASYIVDNRTKYIPYSCLFERREVVEIHGMGPYEMYANRDSISYRSIYGIDDIKTIIRGTLRHTGYCDAWQALIDLGLTDDILRIDNKHQMSLADLVRSLIPEGSDELQVRVANYLELDPLGEIMSKLDYLQLFDEVEIKRPQFTCAQVLEDAINERWKLAEMDKDMIIMQHEFVYEKNGKTSQLHSTFVLEGENAVSTAMSKTVGLPLAIFAKLVMTGVITKVETARPVTKEIYEPILSELEHCGITFRHTILN